MLQILTLALPSLGCTGAIKVQTRMSDEWVADGGRGSHRVKASAMTFQEMTDMVQVLDEKDYDCKLAIYTRPNTRKHKIMEKVVRRLRRRYSVERSKDQLRKRWSDLKHREVAQLHKIRKLIKKSECGVSSDYCVLFFFHVLL